MYKSDYKDKDLGIVHDPQVFSIGCPVEELIPFFLLTTVVLQPVHYIFYPSDRFFHLVSCLVDPALYHPVRDQSVKEEICEGKEVV